MCMSSPTPSTPVTKDPVYLRNPYLDGLALTGAGAANTGRNALRIDQKTGNTPTGTPAPMSGVPNIVDPRKALGTVVPNTQPGTAAAARQALTIGK